MFKKAIFKLFKYLLWVFIALFLLLIGLFLTLQLPVSQNYLTGKLEDFLQNKLNTTVSINEINVSFPKNIFLGQIYIEDLERDTLWYSNKIEVNLNLRELLNYEIIINSFLLEGVTAKINRSYTDSAFNFQFIPDAFTGEEKVNDSLNLNNKEKINSNLKIALYDFNLKNIRLIFNDEFGGQKTDAKIGHLNLKELIYQTIDQSIKVGKIKIIDSNIDVVKIGDSKVSTTENSTSSEEINIAFEGLSLLNFGIGYEDKIGNNKSKVSIGSFDLKMNEIDLRKNLIDIDLVNLSNTSISHIQKKVDSISVPKKENSDSLSIDFPWEIRLNQFKIVDNNIELTNKNQLPSTNKFDPNNLNIKRLNLSINNTFIKDKNLRSQIASLSFAEKSGFVLNTFKSDISISDTVASINNLTIETPNSVINNDLKIKYSSIEHLLKNPYEAFIDQKLYNTKISLTDAVFFNKELSKAPYYATLPIQLKTNINGKVNDLRIDSIGLIALDGTKLNLNGNIKGLPNTDSIKFIFEINNLKTNKKDLLKIDSTIARTFNLPDFVEGQIKTQGSLNNIITELKFVSDIGSIELQSQFEKPINRAEIFSANLKVTNFNAGHFLNKQEEIGNLSFKTNIQGKGLDPKSMSIAANGLFEKLDLKGYEHKNLVFDFSLENEIISTNLSIQEKDLDLKLYMSYNPKLEGTNINLALRKAQLKNLGISEKNIEVSTDLSTTFKGLNTNNLSGEIKLGNFKVKQESGPQFIEALIVKLKADSNNTNLQLQSDLICANYNSNFGIDKSPMVFRQQLAPYFNLNDSSSIDSSSNYYFNFNLEFPRPELFEETFVPDLKKLRIKTFTGEYSGQTKQLEVNIDIPQLIYGDVELDSFRIDLSTKNQNLFYNISASKFDQFSFSIYRPKLFGNITHNIIESQLTVCDSLKVEKYAIQTILQKVDSGFLLKLNTEELLLNKKIWIPHPKNYLFFNEKGLIANQFQIENDSQIIRIGSSWKSTRAPLEIALKDFNLSTLSEIIEQDSSLLVNGKLNGDVKIENLLKEPQLSSHLLINNFSFGKDTLGNINVKADNSISGQYNFLLNIDNQSDKIRTKGFYKPESDSFSLNIAIPDFRLATIEPYTANQLSQMKGHIQGNFEATGTISDPKINGKLNFNKAGLHISQTNGYYFLKNETINISNNKVDFKEFKILDKEKNISEINGSIVIENSNDYLLDLNLKASDFVILNTTKESNTDYFGHLSLKTNLNIEGTNQQPKISGLLKILEGSQLTYALPESEQATFEYGDLMEFVDFDSINFNTDTVKAHKDTLHTEIAGIELNTRLEIEDNVKFKIIIDPTAGDYLEVAGNAILSFNMDPSGNMTLSGIYEISKGIYELTYYNLLRKEFIIQPGSNIAWNGDPLNALLNIQTKHIVKTAPLPLVEKQSDKSKEELNAYKKILPIEIILNVTNEMMKPEIGFELGLPDEYKSFGEVQTRLNQLNKEPSELNKQVFSLLMLNRFIPEESSTASSGGGVSGSARSSVSKMISQQLNSMAGKYIKGIDLNFDLDSYNDNTGAKPQGRTELKLELSKELFNEKLIVSLGGNFDLEGEKKNNNGVGNLAQDVSIEYKINDNGTYRLKGYRTNQYEGVIDGDLTKTGVAIIFTRDYNKLFELFKKQKDKTNQ